MSARAIPVAVLLLGVALAAASGIMPVAGAPMGIAALVGAGLAEKLLCISCVAALTLLAVSATPAALLVMISENPEAAATCIAICYIVATT
ncbi:MAG: hypothetical protein LJF06_10985 [Gemmatimonadetes bacterium]|jgi:hypothetical protein|nr:hypothetical protein [Gemmatimonadota bacterium]